MELKHTLFRVNHFNKIDYFREHLLISLSLGLQQILGKSALLRSLYSKFENSSNLIFSPQEIPSPLNC